MTDQPKPVAVMDAYDRAQETSARDARLAWCRAQGINPDRARRVEIYNENGDLYALVTMNLPEQIRTGPCPRKEDHDHLAECHQEMPTRVDRVPVTSLPPAAAAAHP